MPGLKQAVCCQLFFGETITLVNGTVVLSDHGGSGQHQNTGHPDVLTIPFIAYAKPVKKWHRLAGPVSMLDIAPTIAKLMDIQPHPEWEDDLISDIFVSSFCKVPMMRLG